MYKKTIIFIYEQKRTMIIYLKKQHSDIQLAEQWQNVTTASCECMHHLNQGPNHCLNPNQTFHTTQPIT